MTILQQRWLEGNIALSSPSPHKDFSGNSDRPQISEQFPLIILSTKILIEFFLEQLQSLYFEES